MIKEITPVILLMFLAMVLAPKSGWATEVDFGAPGLLEVFSFHLEDGRHQTPGLTLSWALPSKLEYGCREITFREERRGGQIRIELLGVARSTNYDHCRLAKSPVPIEKW